MPVAREEMVKGYEFAKDQYVMFTPEELKAIEEAGTHMADITEFVPIEAIDPVYFDKAYYLAPDKGGAKPYALLAKALRESKRCALGRWAARGKQYIVMIRPVEDGLVMQQLLYAAEVRSIKEIDIPKTGREGRRAEARAAADRAAGVRDVRSDRSTRTTSRARIEAAVQKKVEGQEITMAEAPEGRRAGHRSDGSAAREPGEEGAGAPAKAAEPKPRRGRSAQAGQARAAGRSAAAPAARKTCKEIAAVIRREVVMHPYGVRDVEKLLGLPRSTIRALIAAGFVSPARGPRDALAVLLPGPDRAAHRAGAGRCERSAAAHHAVGEASCAAIFPKRCRCRDCASAPLPIVSWSAKAAAAGRRNPASTCWRSKAIRRRAR